MADIYLNGEIFNKQSQDIESDISTVDSYTKKIDNYATSGLSGTYNSLAYRVHEIEKHIHGYERWFGLAGTPTGETHTADRVTNAIVAPFRLTSGNKTYGNWVQILGSTDTPIMSGYAYFDIHKFTVVNIDNASIYFIQMVGGESADIATKIAANQFSIFTYIASSISADGGDFQMMMPRYASGTKLWARCNCYNQNAKVIDLYFGLHEYQG